MTQLDRLSEMVKQLRGDLSQKAVAERLGIGQSAVSNWEAGSSMPRLDQIESLAREGGILPEQFVARLYGRECLSEEIKDPIEKILDMPAADRIQALKRIANSL